MFKNWKAICEIQDPMVMRGLALLELDSTLGRRLIEALPEYFTTEKTVGPYPLSALRENARENGRRNYDNSSGEDYIYSYDAIPEDVPGFGFDKSGNNVGGLDGPLLPAEIDPKSPQGTIVTWEGKRMVVIENNYSCEELWLVPAECVNVDC